MISCDLFRSRFHAGADEPELLEHLRSCDACLDRALAIDPDAMFRAIGGNEMVPPGGVDAFVDEVMQQVRVRSAESSLAPRKDMRWPRRLAMAAALAVVVSGALLVERAGGPVTPEPVMARHVLSPAAAPLPASVGSRPVVENYESNNAENATIVEMAADASDDIKIVMIFDENLPVDL